VSFSFCVGHLTIARGIQFFLQLLPLVGCHGWLALRRRVKNALFGGAAWALASISEEPALAGVHWPTKRLDNNSAGVANANIFRLCNTHGRLFLAITGPIKSDIHAISVKA
jgi:hypothetical protein